MPEENYAAFENERDACVLGKITADKYNLKLGDKITLESTIYPVTMDFKIVGIYAGTPDVIATQWDLSDRGATGLMTRFYAELQKGAAVSVALRRAQLWARARHADPALWAPFMVVGEP